MRMLVLCLDNSFGPWHEMYQGGTLKTWCHPSNSQIICRRFMGRDSRLPILNRIGNRLLVSRSFSNHWNLFQSRKDLKEVNVSEVDGVIRVDLPELWSNITLKTLAAMKFALENYEFDFLLRANSTCYLDIHSLEGYLSKKPQNTLYAGPIAKGKDFVSGWGILLSRESVEVLVTSFSQADKQYFDDDAIGRVLKRSDITPQEIPFIEISSNQDLKQTSNEDLLQTPFFRMKYKQDGKRQDDVLMRALHSRFIGQIR
jgi:Galactosyltransferase